MKLTPEASNLVRQLGNLSNQIHNLNQAHSRLACLQRQDQDNAVLYRLLLQQNRSLLERSVSVQTSWHQSSPQALPPLAWLQAELQSLALLVTLHCRLVAWLYGGNVDSDAGPDNSLSLPKAPQPQPQRPASNASPVPALDFD